jgi:uncharacterized protein YwgA
MTPYQLAKVILMAGGINSRKRIQKTFHLLQFARCDFALQYRMHHYGPYSAELAETLDRMARDKWILETAKSTEIGPQYDYSFNDSHLRSLQDFESTSIGLAEKTRLEKFADLTVRLVKTRSRVLELGSTVAEFWKDCGNWDEAVNAAAEYKGEPPGSDFMREALELAMSVTSGSRNG